MGRTTRVAVALLALLMVGAGKGTAQSSMFGVRGLGLPGRPLTPRSRAMGGALGLFDPESDLNPGAIADLTSLTAGFVASPGWRKWETPGGKADLQETRFPLMHVEGPVPGTRLAVGIALASYADRDYILASRDTVSYRGALVPVRDTVSSLGGINEIRFATGLRLNRATNVGAAVYWITGSTRMRARRVFEDTVFVPLLQRAELSYSGFGISLGVTHRLSPTLQVAGMIRSDGHATVQRDSIPSDKYTLPSYDFELPWTVMAGVQWRASRKLLVSGQGAYRTWGGSNETVQAHGGVGSRNTMEFALGAEFLTRPRQSSRLPLRLGARYAELPFQIEPGGRPYEIGASIGTGTRFSQDRAGIDFAFDYTLRREGQDYRERVYTLVLGISIRPYTPGAR